MLEPSKNVISGSEFWTAETILRRISEEEIFEHYLGLSPNTVSGKFCSPLRRDKHPTCTFNYGQSRLFFRDWSQPTYKDCFDIVQDMYLVDFNTALQIIAEDFNLTEKPSNSSLPVSGQTHKRENRKSEKSIIKVKTQAFTPVDKRYLQSYHIPLSVAKYFKVFSVKYAWLNGKQIYTFTKGDPCLAYYFGIDSFGNQKWKLYFYKRRNLWKFICNTSRINGWIQIPESGSKLVITKSMKDVLCLTKFKIPSIAMQGETQIPYDYIIDELKTRYDQIVTFYDFDLTGIRAANTIKKLYGIPYVFLTNGRFNTIDYGEKDISDYLQTNGVDKTEQFLAQCNLL